MGYTSNINTVVYFLNMCNQTIETLGIELNIREVL